MPIVGYSGDPGSGKTYNVVRHVIVPAVAAGRFIVTNISGLDVEKIYDFVLALNPGRIVCLGVVRVVDKDTPGEENFFPWEEHLPMEASNVQAGELAVIDEATRYWGQGDKVHAKHIRFFKEHRHFVNEFGHSCDLVVIDPDIRETHRRLKSAIERTFWANKPKEIGRDKWYTISIYRKASIRGKGYSVENHKFDPAVYELYHSYTGGKGAETAVDARQNIFKGKRLWVLAGVVFLSFGLAVYSLWGFFHPKVAKPQGEQKDKPGSGPAGAAQVKAKEKKVGDLSDDWKIVGYYMHGGAVTVVLQRGPGELRYLLNPDNLRIAGPSVNAATDGEVFTTYSGRSASPAGPVSSPFGRR